MSASASGKDKAKPAAPMEKSASKAKVEENAADKNSKSMSPTKSEDDKNASIQGFPEWSEADLASEKWASKTVFEDTEFHFNMLPRFSQSTFDSWKRFQDLDAAPTIASVIQKEVYLTSQQVNNASVSSKISETGSGRRRKSAAPHSLVASLSSSEYVAVADNKGASTGENVMNTIAENDSNEDITEPFTTSNKDKLSNLSKVNLPLLDEPIYRQIITSFHVLIEESSADYHLWDCIYPKGKDGLPTMNPSGKYFVKLFYMGAWRKLVVDDKVPVSAQGAPLLPVSPIQNEMWSLLIAKALLKLFCIGNEREEYEMDFDALYAIKGWFPERIPVSDLSKNCLINKFFKPSVDNRIATSHETDKIKEEDLKKVSESGQKPGKQHSNQSGAANMNSGTAMSLSEQGEFPARFPIILMHSEYSVPRSDVKEESSSEKQNERKDVQGFHGTFICHSFTLEQQTIFPVLYTRKAHLSSESEEPLRLLNEISNFKMITVYHDINIVKHSKTLKPAVSDPQSKPQVSPLTSPQLLYAQDQSKSMLISVALHGCQPKSDASSIPVIWMQQHDVESIQSFQDPVLRISSAMVQPHDDRIKAYDFLLDAFGSNSSVHFFSDEAFLLEDTLTYLTEKEGLSVKDYEETFPSIASNEYSLISKMEFKFIKDSFMYIQLHCPESVDSMLGCMIYNNDDGKLMDHDVFRPIPWSFKQNHSGYTLYIEAFSKSIIQSSNLRIRIITKEPLDQILEQVPSGILKKALSLEYDDVYVPNKKMVLFRYKMTLLNQDPMQIFTHLRHCNSSMHLKLQIYKNQDLISENMGIGGILYRNIILDPKESSSYIFEGLIDEFDNFLVENATPDQSEWLDLPLHQSPPASAAVPAPAHSKKGSVAKTNQPTVDIKVKIPTWKFRIITYEQPSNFELAKDNEAEEKQKIIKKKWEEQEPGRAIKAKEARENFLKFVENNQIKPIYSKLNQDVLQPWTWLDAHGFPVKNSFKKGYLDKLDLRRLNNFSESGLEETKDYQLIRAQFPPIETAPRVLSPQDLHEGKQETCTRMKQFEEYKKTIVDYRKNAQARSKRMNAYFQLKWDEIAGFMDKEQVEDLAVRDLIRKQIQQKEEDEAVKKANEDIKAVEDQKKVQKTKGKA